MPAFGGRHVFVGNLDAQPVKLRPAHVIVKEFSVLGTVIVTMGEIEELIKLVQLGRITPIIDRSMPLAEARDAHRLMEARQVAGRIVLLP